jgi:hypothetical protein
MLGGSSSVSLNSGALSSATSYFEIDKLHGVGKASGLSGTQYVSSNWFILEATLRNTTVSVLSLYLSGPLNVSRSFWHPWFQWLELV